jgi:hypothetical protein
MRLLDAPVTSPRRRQQRLPAHRDAVKARPYRPALAGLAREQRVMRVARIRRRMPESRRGRRQHASADVAPELFDAEEGSDE